MINDVIQVGSWIAKIAWHLVLWVLNALVSLIAWVSGTVIGWLVTLMSLVAAQSGMGTMLKPVIAADLPYWQNVGVLANWMASTFVGNGTIQLCLSVILEVLVFSIVLRVFFWLWAHIPIIGKGS